MADVDRLANHLGIRTRFLEQLDRMLMQDKQGAIDDMLQVLRERGVVQSVSAEHSVDKLRLATAPEGYREHVKAEISHFIGRFLLGEEEIAFREQERSPGLTDIVGTVEVVRRGR